MVLKLVLTTRFKMPFTQVAKCRELMLTAATVWCVAGPQERCGDRDLTARNYDVTVTGFQREGGAYMEMTYQ